MNIKKVQKIVSFVVILLAITMIASNVLAVAPEPSTFTGSESAASGSANNVLNMILGVVQVIAVGVAVIMLIVLAIKYISAAPSEKADIKKSAMTYVVGAVLLFGASGILRNSKNICRTNTIIIRKRLSAFADNLF